jgi:hypothetical protein
VTAVWIVGVVVVWGILAAGVCLGLGKLIARRNAQHAAWLVALAARRGR